MRERERERERERVDLSEDVDFFRETSLLVWLGGSRGVSGESELEIGGCCWQLASQVG